MQWLGRNLFLDKDYKKYLIAACGSAICNLVFYNNYHGAFVWMMIEIGILFWLFFKRHYTEYLCFYLIFMSVSLEYGVYYGSEIFGLKSFRLCGITVGVLLLFPVALVSLFKMKIIGGKWERKYIQLLRFERLTLGIIFISFVIGIFQILINDNGVAAYEGVWKEFAVQVYSLLTLVAIPIYTFTFFVFYDRHFIDKMKKALLAIIISLIIAQGASWLFQIRGEYWDSTVLIVSQVAIFAPYLLLFFLYKGNKRRYALLVMGILSSYFAFRFAFGSGPLIILMMMPLFVVWVLVQNRKYKILICGALCACVLVLSLSHVIASKASMSILLEYKLKQAVYTLQFWKKDWLLNMPNSAKYRIVEFLSIGMEYINKPLDLLLGKGIMGSFSDYLGFIKIQGEDLSAYGAFEWRSGHYFSVHETINVLFLSNGVTGLLYVIYMLGTCLKNARFSPFLLIGMAWFLFYWDYSSILSYFGIMCLVVGLAMVGERKGLAGTISVGGLDVD